MNIENAKIMASTLHDGRIKNRHLHIGIMAVIEKECGFELKRERSYENTSNSRIRKIFPSRTRRMSEDELTRLKQDERLFFNHVYGGKLGNNWGNDGYNFRGMGWPQLTGIGNLKKYCPEWIAIDALPVLMEISPKTAAEVAIRFFGVGLLKRALLTFRYGRPTTDEIGVKWAVNIAAGLGNGRNSSVVKRATGNALKYIVKTEHIYNEVIV